MAKDPAQRPKTIAKWLVMLPLTFREVWRIEGNVLEFDPNDPSQGTYNLSERKVNTSRAKAPQLISAKGIDYRELEKLLKANAWEAADILTQEIMCQISGHKGLNVESIEAFPNKDLRTIDQLWVHYSNGKFGFSTQKKIWLECGGELGNGKYDDNVWQKFSMKFDSIRQYGKISDRYSGDFFLLNHLIDNPQKLWLESGGEIGKYNYEVWQKFTAKLPLYWQVEEERAQKYVSYFSEISLLSRLPSLRIEFELSEDDSFEDVGEVEPQNYHNHMEIEIELFFLLSRKDLYSSQVKIYEI